MNKYKIRLKLSDERFLNNCCNYPEIIAMCGEIIHNLKPFNDLLQALKNPYTNQKVLTKYQNPPARIDEKYQTFCGT